MAAKITVAILGYGFMGSTHADAWRLIDGCVVKGVWARDNSKTSKFASERGIKAYSSFSDVLDDKEVDVVDICTPTYTHAEYAIQALKSGKHVIVEKPMALSLADADKMIHAADESGMKLMVAHVLRFFPEYMKVKELVDEGKLGEICQARAFRGGAFPEWSPWFGEVEKSGGVAVDTAIHDVDYITWISSGIPQRVYAKIRRGAKEASAKYEIAFINVRYKNGMIAFIEASWAHPPSFPFTMKLELDGTEGTVTLDNQSPVPISLFSRTIRQGYAPESLPWKPMVHPFPLDPFYRELSHFVDCVRNDKTPMTDGRASRRSLEVCLASMKSAETGRPVELPFVG